MRGVPGYRAHHAAPPQGRPARGGTLRAGRVEPRRASTRTSATRRPRGSPRSRSTGPRCHNAFRPQTLVEVSAALEAAREDPEVGVIVLTGEGERGVLLGRRPDGPRRHRLHRRGRLRRPLPRHRPAGADAPPAEAGGRDGRRLRGRRRPRPPRLLRPDDRRRQRPLRPDRAAGRLLGRRLRRLPAARPGRDQEGEGVLAALPPVRRRGGARDGPRQHRRPARPSSSARRSPGAARCSPSPPSRCAWSRRASTPTRTATPGSSSSPTTPTSSSTAARRPPRGARRSRRSGSPTSPSSRGRP